MSVAAANELSQSPERSTGQALLSIEAASKRFGAHTAVQKLSLSFYPNEVTLLLGQNGAGKSTVLRLCVGLLRPDVGRICSNVSAGSCGYVGHEPMLFAHLSVEENLTLFAQLRGARAAEARSAAAAALECWGLNSHARKPVSDLSRGLQMRVSLARSLHAEPQLLFLDEPTSALDEGSVGALCVALREIASNKSRPSAVVMATHDIERVRGIATRVILLGDGAIIADSAEQVRSGAVPREACEQVISRYRTRNR